MVNVYEIKEYQAAWNISTHEGHIHLRKEDGTWGQPIIVSDPNEFSVIVDLLRNEKPIFHNEESNLLSTLREPVGEGE